MAVVEADTHKALAGLSAGDIDVLEGAVGLRELNRAGSGLDARTFALVKLATLIALDAPPASYAWQIANALEDGVTAEDFLGVLKAVAPQVGGPRSSQPRRRSCLRWDWRSTKKGRHSDAAVQTSSPAAARGRGRRRGIRVRKAQAAQGGGAAGAGLLRRSAIGCRPRRPPPPAAPARHELTADDTQRLGELGKLHEQGVLTDEEFAHQKASILGI